MEKGNQFSFWRECIVILIVAIVAWGLVTHSSIPLFALSVMHGTPTPTETPTATPAPPMGTINLKIPVEEIAQLDSFSNATFSTGSVVAKMILVVKATETTVSGGAVVRYQSEQFCVSVEAFLDKDGVRANSYDEEKVKYALIGLKTGDLAGYGQMIPDKVQVYLVPDPTCGNGSN